MNKDNLIDKIEGYRDGSYSIEEVLKAVSETVRQIAEEAWDAAIEYTNSFHSDFVNIAAPDKGAYLNTLK